MIWIYGDSWGCKAQEEKPSTLVWPKLVRNSLRDTTKNYSLGGTSIEWSLFNIQKTKQEWAEGDTLLFSEQMLINKWFFKDNPRLSGPGGISRSGKLSDEDKNYCFKWFTEIYNEELEHFHLQAHYCQLNSWLVEKNMNGYVLQGYPRPHIDNFSNLFMSKGKTFVEISDNEWVHLPENFRFQFDKRPGHLSEVNHYNIARQVVKAIKSNSSVDLTCSFAEGFYSLDN